MKASLNQYRQSPRKVRLVIDSIRGKSVERALAELKFIPKRASGTIEKLIKSAVSNAETNSGKAKENLFIKEIRVDEGVTLKRMLPMSKGRAFRINKRTSHITLELGDKQENKKTKKQEIKKTKKEEKETKITKDLSEKTGEKSKKVEKKSTNKKSKK